MASTQYVLCTLISCQQPGLCAVWSCFANRQLMPKQFSVTGSHPPAAAILLDAGREPCHQGKSRT